MALPSSSPSLPSSFDPAIHLHEAEHLDDLILPASNSNSDDLQALHEQTLQLHENQKELRIVIQHRAWKLNDVLRSDDIFNPETPSRSSSARNTHNEDHTALGSTVASEDAMPFSSSPMHYPPSSSPPIALKRKRIEAVKSSPKKRRIIAGFIEEDDSDAEERSHTLGTSAKLTTCLNNEETESEGPMLPTVVPVTDDAPTVPFPRASLLRAKRDDTHITTSSGKRVSVPRRKVAVAQFYESIVAARSVAEPGKARQSYYGVEIHKLMEEVKQQAETETVLQEAFPSVERPNHGPSNGKTVWTQMWTEKYRAKRFTELVGDERTHRQVLKWLKGWDPVVFPGMQISKVRRKQFGGHEIHSDERQMRKILMLTGPPGLGKTTLAHVCARQAGYEVLEINASDERSRDVVKGRIKDALGTENVRGINASVDEKTVRKAGRPVCVVVDEVDGVVSGSGGSGEGGFIKALIDLVQLDQRNCNKTGDTSNTGGRKRQGDSFRFLRPLILICNDVYHPSLRPLRATSLAEIIHVRRPPLDKVISRLKAVLDREGIESENDGVRRLCESTWGIGSRKQGQTNSRGSGEGDIRGVLVAGEWAAHKLISTNREGVPRLTRKWVEEHITVGGSSSGSRGLGRGGVREVVDRVFLEGAGLSSALAASNSPSATETSGESVLGVADIRRRAAINALREMLDTTGEHDRCVTDCFSTYPTQVYQDDTFLSKPNHAYEWLHFHDALSSRVFGSQEWELSPYLPQATLAFHSFFAAVGRNTWDGDRVVDKEDVENEDTHPFSGPRADFAAHEALKQNGAMLSEFQSSFSAPLMRLFRSLDAVATELLPSLMRMTAPDVKPVVVGGSGQSTASVRKDTEKQCIALGVRAMSKLGIKFEKARVEFEGGGGHGGWIYRMEPPLDELTSFHMDKASGGPPAPVRYAIRQVLDQELRKEVIRQRSDAKQARYAQGVHEDEMIAEEGNKENAMPSGIAEKQKISAAAIASATVKRDFFGRVVNEARPMGKASEASKALVSGVTEANEHRVWVSFHEGYSNAVRKPITFNELMAGF